MFRRKFIFLLAFTAILSLMGCQGSGSETATADPDVSSSSTNGITLTIGDISNDPAKITERYSLLADYLENDLAASGVGKIEIRVAPDLETMTEWLANGTVDIYFDSVYPSFVVSNGSGSTPILRQWRKGVEQYNSVIFATKDSGVTSVNDLEGQIVAFEETYSTSGFMLPTATILEADLTMVEKENHSEAVAADEVGFIFSGADENTIQWVLSGKVAAGATDSATYAQDIPEDIRETLVIVGESAFVPRAVANVTPEMEPELVEALSASLLNLDDSENGKAVLQSLDTGKFDEFPGGTQAAFEEINRLVLLVETTISEN